MTDRLPAVWGCLKTDLFATWHRAECLNSCFGAQTDRKLYLCPAEEYTSSMFFLILLYPNNNMENKTRKTEKKKILFPYIKQCRSCFQISLTFLEMHTSGSWQPQTWSQWAWHAHGASSSPLLAWAASPADAALPAGGAACRGETSMAPCIQVKDFSGLSVLQCYGRENISIPKLPVL